MYWLGILFIFIIISVVLERVFFVHQPIMRLLIGFSVIFVVIKFIYGPLQSGGSVVGNSNSTVFGHSVYGLRKVASGASGNSVSNGSGANPGGANPSDGGSNTGAGNNNNPEESAESSKGPYKYTTLFGTSRLDFKELDLRGKTEELEVKTLFGETTIELPSDVPVVIDANTRLGSTDLPNNNGSIAGFSHFESKNYSPSNPHLFIKLSTYFGFAKVIVQ